eukprot:3539151-Rhodomonas_salina.2
MGAEGLRVGGKEGPDGCHGGDGPVEGGDPLVELSGKRTLRVSEHCTRVLHATLSRVYMRGGEKERE